MAAVVEPSPRPHHYAFAHRVLRAFVETKPDLAFETLSDPERVGPFLANTWEIAGRGIATPLPADGLRAETRRTSRNLDLVIVTCPRPEGITEAHYVAIVRVSEGVLRYFTLEASIDFATEQPIAVLCEWAGGKHLNFGPGPSPDPGAFVDALERRLAPLN